MFYLVPAPGSPGQRAIEQLCVRACVCVCVCVCVESEQVVYYSREIFVCRYMKGRITCKQVNTAVDELNKAFDAKYVLLKTSKARMTDVVRRAIRQFKDQERKETKGVWNYSRMYPTVIICGIILLQRNTTYC